MEEFSLGTAVKAFAVQTYRFTEADLEKAWIWQDYKEGIRFAFFRTYEELRELAAILSTARATSDEQPFTCTQRILAQYHSAYRDLQAILIGISDEDAERSPGGKAWSITDTLKHIIEAERSFLFAIQYALEVKRGSGNPPHELSDAGWQAFWVDDPFDDIGSDAPLSSLFAYASSLHPRVLTTFSSTTDEELRAPSRYWESAAMPIRFRLHRFDSHMQQHAIQIEKTLSALQLYPSEAKRLLRLIYNALAEVEGALIGASDFYLGHCNKLARQIEARAQEIAE